MPFVVDASVSACWAFEDEEHPVAAMALDRTRWDKAFAPSLWWFELRNTLVMNERRGRLTQADTAAFLLLLPSFGITLDDAPDEAMVLALARRHRLTAYDAAYLALARRLHAPLATLDRALAAAAIAERLPALA